MAAKRRKRRALKSSDSQPKLPAKSSQDSPEAHACNLSWPVTAVFYGTILLSALLLFQVQPLVSKAILPWFGGSPAVWTTSMLFYQAVLLVGYCYAHLTSKYFSPKLQCIVHAALVLMAVFWLPVYPADEWKPTQFDENPTPHILMILGRTVGLPFLLLSTTAPLVQVWWQSVSRMTPYRLYALSNTGSLVGLLAYPFVVEPNLGTRSQAVVWSAAFAVFALMVMVCGSFAWRKRSSAQPASTPAPLPKDLQQRGVLEVGSQAPRQAPEPVNSDELSPTWKSYLAWLGLSACASVLLLAMTNHVSQNVAVVPLLWIAPLALYLLSFIFAFGDARLYNRGLFAVVMIAATIGCAFLYNFNIVHNVLFLLAIHLTALFACCMVCHGELVRLKPGARHLTAFYLTVSVGGALGGVFVSVVAPHIFLQYYEYPLALIACWLILMLVALRDKNWYLYRGRPLWAWGLILACFVVFLACLRDGVIRGAATSFLTSRNFYGVISVQRTPSDRPGYEWAELKHGVIRHGAQYIDPKIQYEPTTYYAETSGLGYAMRHLQGKPRKRVGALGLGIGTIAAYCEPADLFRFYEIDPHVIRIATDPTIFTYWPLFGDRGATAEIIPGDARLSLERELSRSQQQEFDLLVVDAFTGDAIPVHLLTREAFAIYFQHLATGGILAVHISNRHLDLLPVVRSMAAHYDKGIAGVMDRHVSHWVLLADPGIIQQMATKYPGKVHELTTTGGHIVTWTDDYSNIFSVLH